MSGEKITEQAEIEEIKVWPPGERGGGCGMFWVADAVGRSLRDKEIERKDMPWIENILMMEVIEEVRRSGGLRYPEAIEKV